MTEPAESPGKPRPFLSSVALSALIAVGMLSRLPTPKLPTVGALELRRSVAFYPLVGGLLGGLLLLAAAGLTLVEAPPLLGGVLLTALLSLLSGALHLDGVADFGDAIGSGQSRERMLEIMKDSRIGAHGATALTLVLLAKVALFDAALHNGPPWFFVLVPATARAAVIPVILGLRSARAGGLGNTFGGKGSRFVAAAAVVQALVLVLLADDARPLLLATVGALLLGAYATRRLGGTTGDVYGAAIELAELLAALTLL